MTEQQIVWSTYESPLGRMVLAASSAGLVGAWFEGQAHFEGVQPGWQQAGQDRTLRAAGQQFDAYFAGRLQQFKLALAPRGTAFQQAVWRAIATIDYGHSRSYGDLARLLGRPQAARAVGAATGRNPLSIIVPCHRVLGADGSLVNYAGGIERKRQLLALETSRQGTGQYPDHSIASAPVGATLPPILIPRVAPTGASS